MKFNRYYDISKIKEKLTKERDEALALVEEQKINKTNKKVFNAIITELYDSRMMVFNIANKLMLDIETATGEVHVTEDKDSGDSNEE